MRNTQNEVVIPLEIAIRTAQWKPGFTFLQDSFLKALPDETLQQQENVWCLHLLALSRAILITL